MYEKMTRIKNVEATLAMVIDDWVTTATRARGALSFTSGQQKPPSLPWFCNTKYYLFSACPFPNINFYYSMFFIFYLFFLCIFLFKIYICVG